jgi:hypothetical protein
MMNKSLRVRRGESSGQKLKKYLWFPSKSPDQTPKKRAAVSGGFEVDNREASNRVDRSHSVSKQGQFK